MKIDPNYIFKKITGEKIPSQEVEREPDPDKKKKIKNKYHQLRDVAINALLFPHQETGKDGRPIEPDGKEKLRRYDLARAFQQANDLIDLTSEEISLLKELIAKRTPPLICGQAWNVLDPVDDKKKH